LICHNWFICDDLVLAILITKGRTVVLVDMEGKE